MSLIVTLTGTQGGPAVFNGLAGPGTLVRYGDDGNDCDALKLQFDAGRGTTMRLSQLDVFPAQLHAVFFTHMQTSHCCAGPSMAPDQSSTSSAAPTSVRSMGSR
jgi:ribonuclease Z